MVFPFLIRAAYLASLAREHLCCVRNENLSGIIGLIQEEIRIFSRIFSKYFRIFFLRFASAGTVVCESLVRSFKYFCLILEMSYFGTFLANWRRIELLSKSIAAPFRQKEKEKKKAKFLFLSSRIYLLIGYQQCGFRFPDKTLDIENFSGIGSLYEFRLHLLAFIPN